MAEAVTILTPPARLPLHVNELKTHLRIAGDDGSHDVLLANLIGAATTLFERRTRIALVERTAQLTLERFEPVIYLPYPPCRSVEQITYLDPDGAQRTLDPSGYRSDTAHEPARITPQFGQNWPRTRRVTGAVAITYVAGFDGPDDVPEDVKVAILMIAAHWYENPSATTTQALSEVPMAVNTILENRRMPDL